MGGARKYHPGIDGLRFVAVAMVLVFHADLGWLDGGFLGVSVFFTLSGFLITGLLLAEISDPGATGRVALRRFWARRVRRLAPAALACLAVVALVGPRLAGPSGADVIRGDVLAALAYVANWRFVLADQSYADLFSAPSPVLHFWSLAIEEQFYLVFPLLIGGLAWLGWRRRGVGLTLLGLAAVSTLLSVRLSGPDRVYYGTDTRAAELLLGGVLACVAGPWLSKQRTATRSTRLVSLGGLVALVAIIALGVTTEHGDGWLYAGGLTAFAVLSTLLVAAAIVPGPARRLLSQRPFVATGRVSYGLYLYHWPIFVWLTPAVLGFGGIPRFVVLVAITATVAGLSYRFLELPVREGRMPSTTPLALASFATAVAVVATAAIIAPRPSPDPGEVALLDESATPVLLTPTTPATAAKAEPDLEDAQVARPASLEVATPHPTILVLGSSSTLATTLRDALAREGAAAGSEPAVQVVDRSDPSCPVYRAAEVTGLDGPHPVACPDFRDTWVRAVAELRPDAVVVGVGALERLPYRLDAAAAPDDLAQHRAGSLRLMELGVAIEVLDDLDPPAFVHDAGPAGDPVGTTIVEATSRRPSVQQIPDLDQLAAASASGAREHATQQLARPPRWLVVGDSTARSVAAGLAAGADGRIEVVAAGVVGCPVVRTTTVRPTTTETRSTDYCPTWDDSWPTWLDAYEPDAVLVVSSAAEQWEQRYPGSDDWNRPGSPTYVEWHDEELAGMVASVADRGVPILVLEAPDIDAGPDGLGDEPEAISAWNAQITRWDEAWIPVREVPYAAHWAEPRSDTGRRERPDGIHPAADVMEQLARTSLVDELLETRAEVERDMRRAGCLVEAAGQPRLDVTQCRADG